MKLLDILLLPFAVLYGAVMRFRNYLYDRDIKKSFSFDTCVLSVGNLSVGGTGKTPMTEYLIRLLSDKYQLTTLSRGYGRKTRGFRLADVGSSARTIGDEPYQYFRKFDDIHVAVGEERALAIPFILAEVPETAIILMDDAFQHRSVLPDFQIMVSDYGRPFYNDHILPAGRLREPRSGARRADAIVISKCPQDLSSAKCEEVIRKTGTYAPDVPVYFTSIAYDEPVCVQGKESVPANVILVTGIANPTPLVTHLKDKLNIAEHLVYPDHHLFTDSDIRLIVSKLKESGTSLLTTEKDLMRLMDPDTWPQLSDVQVFYVPIRVRFLHEEEKFKVQLLNVVEAKCS